MSTKQNRLNEYIIAFLAVFASFMISWFLKIKNNMTTATSLIIIGEVVLVAYALYLKKNKRFDEAAAVRCVFLAGMIMGVGNMIGTHIYDKGYDQGYVSVNAAGHFGYILNLVEGHLPNGNQEQYYQPPFFHFCASIFVRIGNAVAQMQNSEDILGDAIQFAQIANCTVFCFFMIAVKNFIGEIGIKEKYQPFAAAIIAFHPTFFLAGLRGNNDMFATFFILLCIINTYRWYKKRDMKTIILLALSFGFGMMSKISVGVMAFFTGAVMIYCAVKDLKKETIVQFAVFAAICFPLAMWYPIRNYALFDQPFNYVQRLSETVPIYTGDIPWYKRFLYLPIFDVIKYPFFSYPEGESISEHILQTSLFAESKIEDNIIACSIFESVNVLTIIAAVYAAVYTVVKGSNIRKEVRFGGIFVWALLVASFIQFNISYPYLCTADFRYISVTAVAGAVFMAYAMQTAKPKYVKFI